MATRAAPAFMQTKEINYKLSHVGQTIAIECGRSTNFILSFETKSNSSLFM